MPYTTRILDRQVGRNAQLFAHALGDVEGEEARYPYLRILVALIENAHPEWNQAPRKEQHIAELAVALSQGRIDKEEVMRVVRVRDEERGLGGSN